MKKENLNFKRWIVAIGLVLILFAAFQIYGSYQYYVSTAYVRIVEDVNRYEMTSILEGDISEIESRELFPPDTRNTADGFALPINFDKVDFSKEDFTRVYQIDMYMDDKKLFTAYLSAIDKEKATPLYNVQTNSGRLYFYDIKGQYYAIEIMGQFLCLSESQSEKLAEHLK